MPERDLRNANFVFFGRSSGIGLAAAKEIGRRGANVLLVGRSAAAGAAAVAEVLAAGAGSATFSLPISRPCTAWPPLPPASRHGAANCTA